MSFLASVGTAGGVLVASSRPSLAPTKQCVSSVLQKAIEVAGSLLGFPRPLLVAMLAADATVELKGRLGETDRTRSARTASLNVVVKE